MLQMSTRGGGFVDCCPALWSVGGWLGRVLAAPWWCGMRRTSIGVRHGMVALLAAPSRLSPGRGVSAMPRWIVEHDFSLHLLFLFFQK
jgi:hypothetical protein